VIELIGTARKLAVTDTFFPGMLKLSDALAGDFGEIPVAVHFTNS